MVIIITVAAAAEEFESYFSNSNCIIESYTSATRVIRGQRWGDYWTLVGLDYFDDMVDIDNSCYLAWSPFVLISV